MRPSRPSRVVAAFIALISILFMQFAVASYACPGLAQVEETASAPSTMSGQGLSTCHHVEMEQPGLCHAHIQAVKQSLDKPELPHVQPFVAIRLARLLSSVDVIHSPPATPVETVQLARATAPPLAIRNCCFRI
jgi:hypothetical protein